MIYLLQSPLDGKYLLLERTNTAEHMSNNGVWTESIPTSLLNCKIVSIKYSSSGKVIKWWLPRYSCYVDARLIVHCKTLESYHKWCDNHPELFI